MSGCIAQLRKHRRSVSDEMPSRHQAMKKPLILILAAALVAQASAQTPTQNAEALYRQGQAAEKAGDPAAAQRAYAEALKANPNHASARFSIGQLKLNAGAISARGREARFGAVLVPEFNLSEASLQDALEALRMNVEKQSKEQVTPNFVIQDPKGELASAKITIRLKSTPAKAVLHYVLEQAGAKARFDEHAIVIVPIAR